MSVQMRREKVGAVPRVSSRGYVRATLPFLVGFGGLARASPISYLRLRLGGLLHGKEISRPQHIWGI